MAMLRGNDGKYGKVFPCYVCGKSAGDEYYSHPDTDGILRRKRVFLMAPNDELLCLCHGCYCKLKDLPGKEALKVAFG